ncbi:MAG: hypothetical protein J0L92_40505 [Deltaproteobacteria bacterium]|nr:hypothetical protein [Deltaproteobacteria bacterium]
MSRVPSPPPRNLDDRPTIAGSTLGFSAALTFAVLGGVVFLPWAIDRWCCAIRAQTARTSKPTRTMRSGLAFLVVFGAPMLAVLVATMSAGAEIEAANVIGPVGLTLLLLPLFMRLPLVLADSDRLGIREAAARSIAQAIAAPITTIRLTLAIVGALTFAAGVALQIAEHVNDFAVVVGALALLPVLLGGLMWIVSRQTPTEAPRLRPWMLGVLACFFGLPFFLIVLAGGLATSDPRDVTVITDGRGHQHERGIRFDEAPRGVLETERFTVTGAQVHVHVAPVEGAPYDVPTRYPAAVAHLSSEPCSGWHARLDEACRRIAMRGPDWEMELLVDRDGRRLDDGALDRALERVGRWGVLAVLVAVLVLATMLVWLTRLIVIARRVSGRDRALRLEGTLELGEGGTIEPDGRVRGAHNRVTLREGGVVLRLPDSLRAVGVARESVGRVRGVRVACDRVPGIVTHRSAEAAWPEAASLVIGEPEVIEAQALGDAQRSLSRFVLVGTTAGVIALFALSSA